MKEADVALTPIPQADGTIKNRPIAFYPNQRNRVSTVDITVNCGTDKRNPVSELRGGDLFFTPKQRNRVSTVNITVNCGTEKRNPVSKSPESAIALYYDPKLDRSPPWM